MENHSNEMPIIGASCLVASMVVAMMVVVVEGGGGGGGVVVVVEGVLGSELICG